MFSNAKFIFQEAEKSNSTANVPHPSHNSTAYLTSNAHSSEISHTHYKKRHAPPPPQVQKEEVKEEDEQDIPNVILVEKLPYEEGR